MNIKEKIEILEKARDSHILTINKLKEQPVSESQRDILKDFESNLIVIKEKITKLKFEQEQENLNNITLKTGKQK